MLSGVFADDRSPDFRIQCGEDEYNVDIGKVSLHSEYFRRAHQFSREASERCVTLRGDLPVLLGLMVQFFHEGGYDATCLKPDSEALYLTWIRVHGRNPYASSRSTSRPVRPNKKELEQSSSQDAYATSSLLPTKRKHSFQDEERSSFLPPKRQYTTRNITRGFGHAPFHTPTPRHLLLHLQLWEVADKYLVPELQALCTRRFKESAQYYYAHPEMIDALFFVYEDLPEHAKDLRDVVVAVVDKHRDLLEDEEIKESPLREELEAAIRGVWKGYWDKMFEI